MTFSYFRSDCHLYWILISLAFQENCEHCLEEEKKILKESIEANEGIMNFITNMKNDLDKIENNLKSTGNYQPYVEELVTYLLFATVNFHFNFGPSYRFVSSG